MLFDGRPASTARIVAPAGIEIEVPVEQARFSADEASCGVRKDGGDDIDATDGLLVRALVRRLRDGNAGCVEVAIAGGTGVGTVTRPGLEQPVGEAAINSVPRAMIRAEVERACRERGAGGSFEVIVSVDGGEKVAARTFNPNLGIEGGISILGTSGIVRPQSLAALRESIELEIGQHAAEGAKSVVIVPGNYGLDHLRHTPDLAPLEKRAPVVSCSNFIGAALDAVARGGFTRALIVGHAGKMVKVAGGIMDTHSRTADARVEIMCAHAAVAGASRETCKRIMGAATTDAAFDEIDRAGLREPVAASLAAALHARLARRAAGAFEVAAIVFSNALGELFRTESAERVIAGILREETARPASSGKENS